MFYKVFSISLIFVMLFSCTLIQDRQLDFIKVENGSLTLNSKNYKFVGTNLWYGAYLGQPGLKGDRQRLINELDLLIENGITNLRVMGASEESPFKNSLKPTFIYKDEKFDQNLLIGMDFLLSEMKKRGMYAVIFLNNFWEWSGGMSAINSWSDKQPPIDPVNGDWDAFIQYSSKFYQNKKAQDISRQYISELVTRINSITGESYINDPTIMSWQLANEPRPGRGKISTMEIQAYYNWIYETAKYIKSLDPNHLVSTGSEGVVGSLNSTEIYKNAHISDFIDYLTFHMWAKNWNWIDPNNMNKTYQATVDSANNYILTHVKIAYSMNKPIVIEEFGFPRDNEMLNPASAVTYRDMYFKLIFSAVELHNILSGSNFWSWGGFGSAQRADYWWEYGDPFTGDPPQEPQGLNSVFVSDETTLEIIKDHAKRIGALE